MINREKEKLEATKLVKEIRKGAGLTKEESKLLSEKMKLPTFDLIELPKPILDKLRVSAKEKGILEYKSPTGKVLSL